MTFSSVCDMKWRAEWSAPRSQLRPTLTDSCLQLVVVTIVTILLKQGSSVTIVTILQQQDSSVFNPNKDE